MFIKRLLDAILVQSGVAPGPFFSLALPRVGSIHLIELFDGTRMERQRVVH